MKSLLTGVSILAVVVAAQGAAAQTASTKSTAVTPTATTDAKDSTSIQEVVVTAQRRTESAQKAAIPIDVVTAAALTAAGVVTPTTLNAAVPSLIVTKAGGANTSFYVRGVGNFTSNAYADPAIAFNVDGVYLGRPTSTTGTFFDLDRIEVLKGPQGTLYGRNATGGAINVIPTQPKLGQFSGYANLGYGDFNAFDGEAAVNLPVGDHVAVRAAVKIVNSDGYNKDGTNDEVGQAMRLQVLEKVSDDLSIRVAADISHQGGLGPGASFNGAYSFAPGAPAAAQAIPGYVYTPAPANLGPYSGLLSPGGRAYFSSLVIGGSFINPAPIYAPFVNNTYSGINTEVKLKTGVGTFTFIPAYRDSQLDSLFNGPSFEGGLIDEHDRQFSTELRLEGKSVGPLDWLVGAYYFDENIRARYTFSQYLVNVYQNLTTGTASEAGFGRVVFHVTDKFRLVGGARYTQDRKTFNVVGDTLVEACTNAPPPGGPGCFGGPSVPVAPSLGDLTLTPAPSPNGPPVPFGSSGNILIDSRLVSGAISKNFSRITYKAGAEYDLAPASLLYVSYETGFHSGGFSVSPSHPTFAPEYIEALTLGSKNRFLANRLQLNVEAFRWNYSNQQVSHFGFEADGTTNLYTENLGRSTIQGVDIDLQYKVTRHTLLTGSADFLDNHIDSFTYKLPYGGANLPPVTGCKVTAPNSLIAPFGPLPYIAGPGNPPANAIPAAGSYSVNCAGGSGYNSPKVSLNGGIAQTLEVRDYTLVLTADARYRSNRITGFERLAQQNSGSDTTVDLSASLTHGDDRWSLTAYVRNVGDVAAASATQYGGSTGGSVSTIYAPPRTFGFRAGVQF